MTKKPVAIVFSVVAFACLLLPGCAEMDTEPQEVARLRSPSGEVDAVVTEIPTGATVSTPYLIFIVAAEQSFKASEPVLKVDKVDLPSISWVSKNSLSISCLGGRVWHYQSFIVVRLKDGTMSTPEIAINCSKGRD